MTHITRVGDPEDQAREARSYYERFRQRAAAAFRAISLLCSGVSFSALALPPLRPPCRPNSTAAGFFPSYGSGSGR